MKKRSKKLFSVWCVLVRIVGGNEEGAVLFGVLIYEGVEPIDLATFGVLSMARRLRPEIEICTIAPEAGVIRFASGLRVVADYGFEDAPVIDVLVVTGGPGWSVQATTPKTLAFVRRQAARIPIISVCTGGMILAASGVLDGKMATTKREVVPPEVSPLQRLRDEYPAVEVCEASLVDAGSVITGGGVSLCIDAMLHVLQRFFGPETASETARIIEYQRAWAANLALFPPIIPSAGSNSNG